MLCEDNHQDTPVMVIPVVLDEELKQKIQSLNNKQRKTFDVIHQWAREFVKNTSAKLPTKIDPLHIFITGKGGCDRSHLLKSLLFSPTKTLSYHTAESSKEKVLLLATTGVAAININSTTIHSALKIPFGRFVLQYCIAAS